MCSRAKPWISSLEQWPPSLGPQCVVDGDTVASGLDLVTCGYTTDSYLQVYYAVMGGGGLWKFKYIAWPHGSIHFGFPRVFWRAFSSRQPLGGSRLCASWAACWFSPSGRSDSTSQLTNPFSQCERDLHTARSPSFHKSLHVFQTREKCCAHTFRLLHVMADGPSACYVSLAFS